MEDEKKLLDQEKKKLDLTWLQKNVEQADEQMRLKEKIKELEDSLQIQKEENMKQAGEISTLQDSLKKQVDILCDIQVIQS